MSEWGSYGDWGVGRCASAQGQTLLAAQREPADGLSATRGQRAQGVGPLEPPG